MEAEIRQWCSTQENLDVYCVNAIYVGSGDKRAVCMSYWKTAACLGLQTFGIVILMTIQWEYSGFNCSDAKWCLNDMSTESWIAFFFASFVSISCGEQLRTLGEYGMYKWGSQQPACVSRFWVAIGLWTNTLVLILTWACSTLTILASKELFDIVLNSVAVLFMITLDDEIIGFNDYSQISSLLGQGSTISRCQDILDKFGSILLKFQLVWKVPYLCSIINFLPVILIPLIVLWCYGESEIDGYNCSATPAP